jgi:hypothetical protein
MKSSILAIIFFIFFGFLSSCHKDEPTPAEKLVGKWSSGTASININAGDMTLSQYLVSTGLSSTEALLYTAIINSTVQSYFTGELQVNADKTFTWTTSASSTTATGTWSVDDEGRELTLNSTIGLGGVFEITELSGTKLNIHSLQNLNSALMGYALPSSFMVEMTLSFIKD